MFAVLGNHDFHAERAAEIEDVLRDAGVRTLDRGSATCEVDGLEVCKRLRLLGNRLFRQCNVVSVLSMAMSGQTAQRQFEQENAQ